MWGATSLLLGRNEQQKCFNSRTPCGVRHLERLFPLLAVEFQFTHPVWGATEWCLYPASVPDVSIHAPRVGCDSTASSILSTSCSFNSRTPCGVRPQRHADRRVRVRVSIHAPRVGCDRYHLVQTGCQKRFNSRTPCGVRPTTASTCTAQLEFQFTHPVWGATYLGLLGCGYLTVSIHAPRVGCD